MSCLQPLAGDFDTAANPKDGFVEGASADRNTYTVAFDDKSRIVRG